MGRPLQARGASWAGPVRRSLIPCCQPRAWEGCAAGCHGAARRCRHALKCPCASHQTLPRQLAFTPQRAVRPAYGGGGRTIKVKANW